MNNNKSWLATLAVVAALAAAQPARAITYGELDNGRHPNVGAVMIKAPWFDPPLQYMSGTLIGSNLFLTAAHGTSEIEYSIERSFGLFSLSYVYVTFADDPYDESCYLPVVGIVTHPGYKPGKYSVADGVWRDASGCGRIPVDDVALLVLGEAPLGIEPAVLPTVGFLDELKKSGQLGHGSGFLAVGYGCQATFSPPTIVDEPNNRGLVMSDYRGFNEGWLTMAINPMLGIGGAGYGDSGGPRYWVDPGDGSEHLVSITSRGDPMLVATDITYRIDTSSALDFIQGVIDELALLDAEP